MNWFCGVRNFWLGRGGGRGVDLGGPGDALGLEVGGDHLAQDGLFDLGAGHGPLGHEPDVARDPEGGDVARAERDDLLFGAGGLHRGHAADRPKHAHQTLPRRTRRVRPCPERASPPRQWPSSALRSVRPQLELRTVTAHGADWRPSARARVYSMFARMSRYGTVAGGTRRQQVLRSAAQSGTSRHVPAPADTGWMAEQRTLNLRARRSS
jgi:hypothetical protein